MLPSGFSHVIYSGFSRCYSVVSVDVTNNELLCSLGIRLEGDFLRSCDPSLQTGLQMASEMIVNYLEL